KAGHVPDGRMQAWTRFGLELADLLAREVEDLQGRFVGFPGERVKNRASGGRVLADEMSRSGPVERVAFRLAAPADNGVGLVQVYLRFHDFRRHLPQGRDVEHPEAADVRGGDYFAGRGVNGELVHG